MNEIAPKEIVKEERNEIIIYKDILQNVEKTIGLELSPEEKQKLYRPVPEERIEIKPTGEIYIPWNIIQERLNEVFGLDWALVPAGNPYIYENSIIWGFYLVIKKKIVAFAFGECEYHPNNPRMKYTDALEGAKSVALRRCAKQIGLFSYLWDPSFIRNWIKKYAEKTEKVDPKTQKIYYVWRKKNEYLYIDSEKDKIEIETEEIKEQKQEEFDKEDKKWIKKIHGVFEFLKKKGWTEEEYRKFLKEKFDVDSSKDLTLEQKKECYNLLMKLVAGEEK